MGKKLQLHLKKLHCYANEESRYDDVFLKFNGKRIWPTHRKQLPVRVGIQELDVVLPEIPDDEPMVIELWDYDYMSPNDHFGDFVFQIEKQGGPFRTDMKRTTETDIAKYTLEWSVEGV